MVAARAYKELNRYQEAAKSYEDSARNYEQSGLLDEVAYKYGQATLLWLAVEQFDRLDWQHPIVMQVTCLSDDAIVQRVAIAHCFNRY